MAFIDVEMYSVPPIGLFGWLGVLGLIAMVTHIDQTIIIGVVQPIHLTPEPLIIDADSANRIGQAIFILKQDALQFVSRLWMHPSILPRLRVAELHVVGLAGVANLNHVIGSAIPNNMT
jgi:hypothetical protein